DGRPALYGDELSAVVVRGEDPDRELHRHQRLHAARSTADAEPGRIRRHHQHDDVRLAAGAWRRPRDYRRAGADRLSREAIRSSAAKQPLDIAQGQLDI